MSQTSFALLTNLGRAKEAAALANAGTIEITHIAIGDGATVPSGGETALYHEVARKTISGHGTVSGADNVAYFDCYLAAGDGPYTIREAGLYDSAGDLIAIAHYDPPINKPVPASGQTVEGTVRLEVAFSNIATVVIVVDPSMQVALQRLTRLPWVPVIEIARNTPPASPVPGDTYVIGSSPTGSWAGHAGKLAEYTTAGWALLAPPAGHGVGLPDGSVHVRIGSAYVERGQVKAAITRSGLTYSALDQDQLAKAARSQRMNWVGPFGGTVNALTCALDPAPAALADLLGMPIRGSFSGANTGEVTLAVNGLAATAVTWPDGTALRPGDLRAAEGEVIYDGTAFRLLTVVSPDLLGQRKLTQNVNLYVNPSTGSDSYDGTAATVGSGHGPFQTLNKALEVVAQFAPSTFGATINLSAGTHNPRAGSSYFATSPWAHCPVTIDGAGATTILNGTNGVLRGSGPNSYTVRDLALGATCSETGSVGSIVTTGGFNLTLAGEITFLNISNAGGAFFVHAGLGTVNLAGTIKVSGSPVVGAGYGTMFAAVGAGASVVFASGTLDFTTTVNCAQFVRAFSLGAIVVATYGPTTITNAARLTGSKYQASLNGIIDTGGNGLSYFPGSTAGSTSTGGQAA